MGSPPVTVYATNPIKSALTFDGSSSTGDGYSWDATQKELTLYEGFQLDVTGGESALKFNADAKIILQGNATIESAGTAIEAGGNLTIKSDMGEKGFLKVNVAGSSDGKYAVKMAAGKTLTISDNTIVQLNGGQYSLSSTGSSKLNVTDRSALQMQGGTDNVNNFQLAENNEDFIWQKGTESAELVKKNSTKNVNDFNKNSENSVPKVTIMSFSIKNGDGNEKLKLDTDASGNASYSAEYDGKSRAIQVNTNADKLKNELGISDVEVVPNGSTYYMVSGDANTDYRDKELISKKKDYPTFSAIGASGNSGAKNASTYTINYKRENVASADAIAAFSIQKKPVTVTGLTAKNKTYDGWADAEINSTGATLDGVIEANKPNYYATGYFLDAAGEQSASAGTDKRVDISKMVVLNAPNYSVASWNATAKASITKRDLNDPTITCDLRSGLAWKAGGYPITDVIDKFTDSSSETHDALSSVSNLEYNKDFTATPVTLNAGASNYTITFTGIGNYTGSIEKPLSLGEETRTIQFSEPRDRVANGTKYEIKKTSDPTPGTFTYKVLDSNNNDVTASANATIRYQTRNGTVINNDSTDQAPSAAGQYRVTVTVAGTDNYSEVSDHFDYEIFKKPDVGSLTVTNPIDFFDAANESTYANNDYTAEGYGWSWNTKEKILTLEDGFTLKTTAPKSAMNLKADTTIVLNGNATIETDNTGIEVFGNLTIKSAPGKSGFLKVKLNKKGTQPNYLYAVKMGKSGKLTITDRTIVQLDGGDTSLYSISSEASSVVYVRNQSVLQMKNATANAENFGFGSNADESNKERVIWANGTTVEYLAENAGKSDFGSGSLTIMSCSIEGTQVGDTYTLTYDGEEHALKVNTNSAVLRTDELGNLDITIEPVNFDYDETRHSEVLGEKDSDFRDKDIVSTTTKYQNFTAADPDPENPSKLLAPVNAATYNIFYTAYGSDVGQFATLTIDKRKVKVDGLKAKDKTYDHWADAEIDYSGITITALNDTTSSGDAKTKGIVAADKSKIGSEIVYYAKAFFIEGNTENGNVKYNSSQSATAAPAQKDVKITEISLSDPNYEVIQPNAAENKSQGSSKATIYPRSLEDEENISCELKAGDEWTLEGYTVEQLQELVKVTDKSHVTKNGKKPEGVTDNTVELKKSGEDKDYLVNPNTNKMAEVAEYEIILTGLGNYTGTKRLNWKISQAKREITIVAPDRVYDGTAYEIKPASGDANPFSYQIKDTKNDQDVTNNLEEGSKLKITYEGISGTDYGKSLTAPTNAGTYKVTVRVEETTHYTSAEESKEFKILPKTVSLKWYCRGGSVGEDVANPTSLTYNGTANKFYAVVDNPVEGDKGKVNVTGYTYYKNGSDSPIRDTTEVASYTVKANAVNNANYTVNASGTSDATPVHSFTIEKAEVDVTWTFEGTFTNDATDSNIAVYTYDTKDHTPKATVQNLYGNDICNVTSWSFTGADVFGVSYTQTNGTKNVSQGNIVIKAEVISNSNYKLKTNAATATFKIVQKDLSEMTPGTYGNHSSGDGIWAGQILFSSKEEEPKIYWSHKIGDTVENTLLKKDTDYTAGLSTKALEYNKNGLRISLEGKNNYKGSTILDWNIDKIESSIKIKNYQMTGETPFSFVYGEAMPAFDFEYENQDIERNNVSALEDFLTYEYEGTLSSGKPYGPTSEAPTKAGTYQVTVTMGETDHYKGSSTSTTYTIDRREFVVKGIKGAGDKVYDGSADALLDFSGIASVEAIAGSTVTGKTSGIVTDDQTEITNALSNTANAKRYINYQAYYYDASSGALSKDVAWTSDNIYTRAEADKDIRIQSLAINYDAEDLPAILYNYTIAAAGNQDKTEGKIIPAKVQISGIKAKDRAYNGSKEVTLDVSGMEMTGVASGEALKIEAKGLFQNTGTGDAMVEAKDVRLDNTGKPGEKVVAITYEELRAGNDKTDVNNYKLVETEQQKETTAIITPAELTIVLDAEDKTFDNTSRAKLKWDSATVEGVVAGDIIVVDTSAELPTYANYSDANVSYDRNGDVTDKTATIPSLEVKLIGTFNKNNYVVMGNSFKGKIEPKELTDAKWSFNSQEADALPNAAFDVDCGVVDGDTSEVAPVVKYYASADAEFAQPIETTKDVSGDGTIETVETRENFTHKAAYVAVIKGVTNKNYSIGLIKNDDLVYPFVFRADLRETSRVTISGYEKKEDGTLFTVTYGEVLPQPGIDTDNSDIKGNPAAFATYFTYQYTGTMRNGASYESSEAPTQAGTYKLTVTQEATANYKSSKASVFFTIAPAKVTILQGVTVDDKVYNGTDKATLNFRNVTFDGILSSDASGMRELFANAQEDYIRYSATYAKKDVLLKEMAVDATGRIERVPADLTVTAGGYSFILVSTTPDILYNYEIAEEGNPTSFRGKILPKEVTVSGIAALDKTYDGTAKANLDLANVEFDGRLKGETLKADVTGTYQITGTESAAADVLLDASGKAMMKNIVLTIAGLEAGDEATNADNYVLAAAGQQTTASAKIAPAVVTISSGLSAKDKVYNATTAATLDFSAAVFDGMTAADKESFDELLEAGAEDLILYDANFEKKDVAWTTKTDGTKEVAEIAVQASKFAFAQTAPKFLTNYRIADSGNQAGIKGKILPKEVTVSGIRALDKTYDGKKDAVLDPASAVINGFVSGDALAVDVAGIYLAADGVAAEDVVLDQDNKAVAKKIAITIKELKAANASTVVENYVFAPNGQQTQTESKIVPAVVTIKSGLRAKDKVYNATTNAELDFSGVVFEGAQGLDLQALTALVRANGDEVVLYDANYAQKDVAWAASGEAVAEVAVTASRYAFAQTQTAPKLLKNFIIAESGNQAAVNGKILPKEVTVSGIKALDKTYDGTKDAVVDLSAVVIDGFVTGDKLTADVTGTYVSASGEAAADVVLDENFKAAAKKIVLSFNGLKAADGTTNPKNYVVAAEGLPTETSSKILPAVVTIKSGLSAKDKVYNGTTNATLDFSNVVVEGAVGSDSEALTTLIRTSGEDAILYNAVYVGKDVAWTASGDGTEAVGEIAVTASDLAFVQSAGMSQLLKNYVLTDEGMQAQISGKILPKEVTVSGIKALNKTYDGTDKADVDQSAVRFEGRLAGDKLAIEATGKFLVTGSEKEAGDVLIAKDSQTQKKVVLTLGNLKAGDTDTVVKNYTLVEGAETIETSAVINPVELKSVTWTFNTTTQLPSAAFADTKAGTPVVRIYAKTDKSYKTAVTAASMKKGTIYVARVEGTDNTNYAVSSKFTNPIYTFAYGTEETTSTDTKKETVTAAQKAAAVLAVNKGLSLKWSSKKLTFKWGKVSGADGYYVYTAKVGKSFGKAVTVKGKTSYSVKQTSKTAKYKAYVKAYKLVNGKAVVLGKSYEVRCAGSSVSAYDATKVKVKKSSISLAKGKTAKAGASIQVKKIVTKNKKTTTKTVTKTGTAANLTYWSTNTKVATVTSAGDCVIIMMSRGVPENTGLRAA